MANRDIPFKDRFWSKVRKTDDCWFWTSVITFYGYGTIKLLGKRVMAHRISYELTYGAFDKSLYVCHKCDNPTCVRPDHLFLGTQKDNMQDCVNKNRTNKTRLAKHFKIVDPSGNIIDGFNITQFCKDYHLQKSGIQSVLAGRANHHKGYTRFIE